MFSADESLPRLAHFCCTSYLSRSSSEDSAQYPVFSISTLFFSTSHPASSPPPSSSSIASRRIAPSQLHPCPAQHHSCHFLSFSLTKRLTSSRFVELQFAPHNLMLSLPSCHEFWAKKTQHILHKRITIWEFCRGQGVQNYRFIRKFYQNLSFYRKLERVNSTRQLVDGSSEMTPTRSLSSSRQNDRHSGTHCESSSVIWYHLCLNWVPEKNAHMHRIMNSSLPTTQAEHLGESVTSRPFLLQLELAQTEHWWRRAEVGYRSSFFPFSWRCARSVHVQKNTGEARGKCVGNRSNPHKKIRPQTPWEHVDPESWRSTTRAWSFDRGCNAGCAPTQWPW